MALGQYKVSISPDAGDFKGLGARLGKEVSGGLAGKIGSGMKSATKVAAAGVGVIGSAFVGAGAAALKAQSDIQGALDDSNDVFGDNSKDIAKWSSSAASNMGITSSAALEMTTKMGAMLTSQGIDQKTAAQMSMDYAQRAADVAASTGHSQADVEAALTGAAKGRVTALAKLGVSVDKNTLSAYAAAKGYKTQYNAMDQATKSQILYSYFMEKTSKDTGGFVSDSKQLGASVDVLKSSFTNLLQSMGDPDMMKSASASFSSAVTTMLKSVSEMLPTVLGGLVSAIVTILPTLIPQVLTALQDMLSAIMESLVAAFPQIIAVIQAALPQFLQFILSMLPQLITMLVQLVVGIVNMLPQLITTIAQALPTLIPILIQGAISLFMALVQALPQVIVALVNALPDIIVAVVNGLTTLIPALLEGAIQLFTAIPTALPQILPVLLAKIPGMMASILGAFGGYYSKMAEIGANLIKGIWNGIQNVTGWIMDKIRGFSESVMDAIKGFFGIHSPSKLMADIVGVNLGLGVGVGLEDSLSSVSRTASGFSKQITGAMNFDPNVNLGGGRAFGTQVNVYQTVEKPKNMLDLYLVAKRGASAGAVEIA